VKMQNHGRACELSWHLHVSGTFIDPVTQTIID
jgi:hypothetical protein